MANVSIVSLYNVSKSKGIFRKRKVLLSQITANFEKGSSYAILGTRESGTDTLLSLLAGTSRPSSGQIVRNGSVTIPVSATAQVAPYKSGKELVYFMARLYRANAGEVSRFVADFSGLPTAVINGSIGAMTVEERIKFSFALGYGLPAEMYLFEGDVQYGNDEFRARCRSAYASRRLTAGTVIATADIKRALSLARRGCVLHKGRLHVFEDISEAVEMYHRVQLGGSTDRVLLHLKTLVQTGQSGRAEKHLRDMMVQNTGSAGSYAALAEMALAAGRNDEAIRAAHAALREGADALRPQIIIAKAKEADGDFAGAVSHIDAIVQPGNLHPSLSILLASNLDKAGDRSRAGRVWKQIATTTSSDTARRRAQASLMKAQDWPELLDLADQMLPLGKPGDPDLLEMRVVALIGLKRWEACLEATKDLSVLDPLKVVNLIYGIARSADWLIAIDLLRVVPLSAIRAVAGERPAILLRTVLGRHATAFRKEGRPECTKIEEAISRLDSAIEG